MARGSVLSRIMGILFSSICMGLELDVMILKGRSLNSSFQDVRDGREGRTSNSKTPIMLQFTQVYWKFLVFPSIAPHLYLLDTFQWLVASNKPCIFANEKTSCGTS